MMIFTQRGRAAAEQQPSSSQATAEQQPSSSRAAAEQQPSSNRAAAESVLCTAMVTVQSARSVASQLSRMQALSVELIRTIPIALPLLHDANFSWSLFFVFHISFVVSAEIPPQCMSVGLSDVANKQCMPAMSDVANKTCRHFLKLKPLF